MTASLPPPVACFANALIFCSQESAVESQLTEEPPSHERGGAAAGFLILASNHWARRVRTNREESTSRDEANRAADQPLRGGLDTTCIKVSEKTVAAGGVVRKATSKGPKAEQARGVYPMSVATDLTGMHAQTLRKYEREGLLQPARTKAGSRRFSL